MHRHIDENNGILKRNDLIRKREREKKKERERDRERRT